MTYFKTCNTCSGSGIIRTDLKVETCFDCLGKKEVEMHSDENHDVRVDSVTPKDHYEV